MLATTDAGHVLDDSVPYTFSEKAEVPWGRLRVGDGYDIVTGQAVPSALRPFQLPVDQPPQYFDFDSAVVETARDVENAVGLSTGISATFFKDGVEASARYLQSVTYSGTSLTTVVRVARICPDTIYDNKPTLTAEAEEVLRKGASQFFEEYGQYFVCGHRSQSTLIATLTHTAASSEQLKHFKSQLGVNYQIASVDTAADLMHKASSCGITTTIKIYMGGYYGPSSAKSLTRQELVPALDDFLANRDKHTPNPHTALLEHYCWVDSRLKMSSLRVPSAHDKALRKCLALEVQCRSSSLQCMKELQPRVNCQRSQVLAIESGKGDWQTELRTWSTQVRELVVQLNKYTLLDDLLKRMPCDGWVQ